ncbi:MAG: helix-turn-helix transcriptional regulator [Prevotella sp.]|nr:helix-turn-helix transcriptional regulator [Prevotella sp.]MBQ6210681.1 helix-turn-helix transcriptional regulator [Prevotella sp.]
MLEIGDLIRQKLKERKRTIVWLAENLSCSRTNVYKIFDKRSIDTDYLLRISDILDYDFFELYSKELKKRKDNGVDKDLK